MIGDSAEEAKRHVVVGSPEWLMEQTASDRIRSEAWTDTDRLLAQASVISWVALALSATALAVSLWRLWNVVG